MTVHLPHLLIGLHRRLVLSARQVDPDATKRLLVVDAADEGGLARAAGLSAQPDTSQDLELAAASAGLIQRASVPLRLSRRQREEQLRGLAAVAGSVHYAELNKQAPDVG